MTENKKSEEEKKESGLYEKFALRTKELIEAAGHKTSDTVDSALEKAKEEMVAAGDFGREQGDRFKAFLRRDLQAAQDGIAKMGEKTREMLEPHRVSAGIQGTVASILTALGSAFEDWADKIESRLDCKTGEMTTPGTLRCKKCDNEIKKHGTGRIPPCPKCRGTEFRKSY